MRVLKVFLAVAMCAALASDASARSVDTNEAGGADVEFRESQPTTARGTGPELASRQAVGSRNSVFYVRFPVSSITGAELANDITVQLHNRAGSLNQSRTENLDNPGNPNAGMNFYLLDPTSTGNAFDEATVTPAIAAGSSMGYSFDGDFLTQGTGTPGAPTAGLTYLGTTLYPNGTFPLDEALDLTLAAGSDLHSAIVTAQGESHESVTIAVSNTMDLNDPTSFSSAWSNFNYQFHSKESNPDLAPSLELVPEPTSLALLALGSLAIACRRR